MLFDTFDRTGSAELPFPREIVFKALCLAVTELNGMELEHCDELAGRLDVKTGMSAFSWGENVSITVKEWKDSTSLVSVQSAAKTIFGSAVSHGKNRENVREIISRTSTILEEKGQEWGRKLTHVTPQRSLNSSKQPSRMVADEIMKLATLMERGLLTMEEFEAQKARLLASTMAPLRTKRPR